MIYGPVYDPAGANDTKTIPYRTAASPTEANPALSTTAEVFGLAKADIDFALKSVPDNVNHPARMNRCAVQTLMAYYYMFARDFGKMLEYADMAWTIIWDRPITGKCCSIGLLLQEGWEAVVILR